jgi:hypothetical protein
MPGELAPGSVTARNFWFLYCLLWSLPGALCADTITQTTDYPAAIYSQTAPLGQFTGSYGTDVVTATVTATSLPPSNPAYAQNVQITLTLSCSGPPGTGASATVAGGGHSLSALVATPGWVNGAYYNFTPSYTVTYVNQNKPANWKITDDGTDLGFTSSGTNTTPVSKVLNGGPDVQLNLNNMTPFPVSQIPSQYIDQNGNVTMVISAGGTALQTISVPAATLASGNVGLFPVSLPPIGTQTLSLGFQATGYTNGAGALTYTGNNSDHGTVPQLLLNPDDGIINAAQIPGNRITLAPLAANTTTNPYNDPSLMPVTLPGPTGVVTPPQATPIWVNPTIANPSYNGSTDLLTNNTYRQGVANQMNQQEQIRDNLSSTVIGQTNLLNTDLQNINGHLGNLTISGNSGGGASNVTIDPNITANIEAWAQRGNDASGNSSAFTRGTDPNANAAMAANMSSTWSGALNSVNVPSTLPAPDFTSADPTSLFQIAIPAAFGGGTIDFNPFRADRLGPTLTAFRTALAWLAVVTFAIWAFKETFAVIKDSGKLSQIVGPKVIVAGESDGGLVVAATYMLLTVGAVAVLLSACVAIYDTDWPIIGQFTALFTTGPFHSYPAQVMWMLDQVFPVGTCVAVLLGRLIYLKLLAVAYIVFMVFYKSKPA